MYLFFSRDYYYYYCCYYWIFSWSKLTHTESNQTLNHPHSIRVIILLIKRLDVALLSIIGVFNEHLKILGLAADSRLPMLAVLIALGGMV